jgi:hypothetical protein
LPAKWTTTSTSLSTSHQKFFLEMSPVTFETLLDFFILFCVTAIILQLLTDNKSKRRPAIYPPAPVIKTVFPLNLLIGNPVY